MDWEAPFAAPTVWASADLGLLVDDGGAAGFFVNGLVDAEAEDAVDAVDAALPLDSAMREVPASAVALRVDRSDPAKYVGGADTEAAPSNADPRPPPPPPPPPPRDPPATLVDGCRNGFVLGSVSLWRCAVCADGTPPTPVGYWGGGLEVVGESKRLRGGASCFFT
jgi:hypothetical protein